MTRQEAFEEINKIQDDYVDELISLINSADYDAIKTISFTSPTGTGKTKMMSKLINKLPEYYFVITTLSKGQLNLQISNSLDMDCHQKNYYVYGSADYRINSKLDAYTIINRIPQNTKCIWLRDEGHIRTNRYDELLRKICYKVINFSATNEYSDIQCHFAQTMMLRTVDQTTGTPEDAIKMLLKVKSTHKDVPGYNPCAIFRCVSGDEKLYKDIITLCDQYGLKYIDITTDSYVMAELCMDDNSYDVIINKQKITEGIDIRRAHVLFMDNQPTNNATTIQVIGRCRRNALLYRQDIDILAPENVTLLEDTRKCYVFYNVENMKVDTDEEGELYYAFCDKISCEALKAGTSISVNNGMLPNGLFIIELAGKTGKYEIIQDSETGFNVVSPITEFYDTVLEKRNEFLYTLEKDSDLNSHYLRIRMNDVLKLPEHYYRLSYDSKTGEKVSVNCEPYFQLSTHDTVSYYVLKKPVTDKIINLFIEYKKKYSSSIMMQKMLASSVCIKYSVSNLKPMSLSYEMISGTISGVINNTESNPIRDYILQLDEYSIEMAGETSNDTVFLKDICNKDSVKYLKFRIIRNYEQHGSSRYSAELIKHEYDLVVTKIMQIIKVLACDFSDTDTINKIIHLVFNGKFRGRIITNITDRRSIQSAIIWPQISIKEQNGKNYKLTQNDIKQFFSGIDLFWFCPLFIVPDIADIKQVVNIIDEYLEETLDLLKNSTVHKAQIDNSMLFEPATSREIAEIDNGMLRCQYRISKSDAIRSNYFQYDAIVNDRESAIIGVDLMQPIKTETGMIWMEASSVTAKISNYNKFNSFLSQKYHDELALGAAQCFSGKNNYKLDKKCNSMIGYCVEYYSKYLVYGESFLGDYIEDAKKEAGVTDIDKIVLIRACIHKYREMMIRSFGTRVSKLIKSMTIKTLEQGKYSYFVELITSLGAKTAEYVKSVLYSDRPCIDNVDPNLSIRHIAGLADFITQDIILDVKVRSNIDLNCVRQVLAYHYLSTKRTDLHIKKVIIYDAASNRDVVIDITAANVMD